MHTHGHYKTVLGAAAIAAASVLVFAAPVFAEDGASGSEHVDLQVQMVGNTTVVGGEGETHASGTIQREDGNGGEGSDASGRGEDSRGNATSSERNKGQRGTEMSDEHSASSSAQSEHEGDMIEFDRDSEDMQASSSATIENPERVKSESDLREFSAGVFEHNKHITHIAVSSSTVSTDFDSPAKLLGFIPASIPAHVDVSGDGSVQVSYPWYAFLFATAKSAVEQAVASSTAGVNAGGSVSLSASEQATLVHSIVAALEDVFNFSASTK